jgi:hypothetical protein
VAQFEEGSALIGLQSSVLKAADVHLLGVGMDHDKRFVFIVGDGYRSKFAATEQGVTAALAELKEQGAIVMDLKEALTSTEPIEVVWNVPVAQANPSEPQALESRRKAASLHTPGTAHRDGSPAKRAA